MSNEFTLRKLKELAQLCSPDRDVSKLTPNEHLLAVGLHIKKMGKGIDSLFVAVYILGARLGLDEPAVDKLVDDIIRIREGQPVPFNSILTAKEYNIVKED